MSSVEPRAEVPCGGAWVRANALLNILQQTLLIQPVTAPNKTRERQTGFADEGDDRCFSCRASTVANQAQRNINGTNAKAI